MLLRGINVGGHNKLPMVDLRQALTSEGFADVKTYIQSGNIILKSELNNVAKIKTKIAKAIKTHFELDIPVLAKTPSELRVIFDDCPFEDAVKQVSYFVLLSQKPTSDKVGIAQQKTYPNEEFHIINDVIYFFPKNGYGRAKFNLAYFERVLETKATARNYKTMLKLLELSEAKP
ncbi:DUF1697 domain-containing protein [Winogradskyella maritima]|uniref:DUF1697 domain-containing protein n=1 Tax=Winogradskyella maritima TaxID=1517766 RepID=A0ABV8AFU2_9FLAO